MAFILADQLKHVTRYRVQRYRPNRFRSILPIDNSPPTWATTVEHSQITEAATDPAVVGNGPVKNLPRPTIDKTAALIRILEFGYAYGWSEHEQEKAAKTGLMLSAALAVANQTAWERFLDAVAAGQRLTTLGLPGLLNIAGKAANQAGAKAGGGTAWAVATFDEMIADVAQSIEAVETGTLENMAASQVILPVTHYNRLVRVMHPISGVSALQTLRSMYQGVTFRSWAKLALANAAGNGPRMVTMATGEDVARMIIPRELQDGTPVAEPGGIVIPQWGSTAGVLVETPDAIVYTDGI
jgi:hypothetical protein